MKKKNFNTFPESEFKSVTTDIIQKLQDRNILKKMDESELFQFLYKYAKEIQKCNPVSTIYERKNNFSNIHNIMSSLLCYSKLIKKEKLQPKDFYEVTVADQKNNWDQKMTFGLPDGKKVIIQCEDRDYKILIVPKNSHEKTMILQHYNGLQFSKTFTPLIRMIYDEVLYPTYQNLTEFQDKEKAKEIKNKYEKECSVLKSFDMSPEVDENGNTIIEPTKESNKEVEEILS